MKHETIKLNNNQYTASITVDGNSAEAILYNRGDTVGRAMVRVSPDGSSFETIDPYYDHTPFISVSQARRGIEITQALIECAEYMYISNNLGAKQT